ncbi:putative Transposon TX1 [Gossypium australe]|uniref:Putative Transposon TX1 n=1 Tax=Gossypium australe TaxID=47621 RepID=A0A5B6WXC4_9ROSI|nr:putative Transposon TX1 [Gossypium australe]
MEYGLKSEFQNVKRGKVFEIGGTVLVGRDQRGSLELNCWETVKMDLFGIDANLFGKFFVQDCGKGIVSKVKGDSQNGGERHTMCFYQRLIHLVKKGGSRGYLIFKLDFSKPYDCVRWDFLELVLFKMRFSVKWRGWMMECISTARVAVIINGSMTNKFKLHREVLHLALDKAVELGIIEGFQNVIPDMIFFSSIICG